MISMYGQTVGVRKIITKINRLEYSHVFADMGVGSVVSPKELCSTEIVRYVRAMQAKTGSVLALHRIADGAAEALEFSVDETVRWCNTPLKDVPVQKGVLISCITHRGETIIPDGTACFRQGDTVIVVATSESVFLHMNDIFEA